MFCVSKESLLLLGYRIRGTLEDGCCSCIISLLKRGDHVLEPVDIRKFESVIRYGDPSDMRTSVVFAEVSSTGHVRSSESKATDPG